MNENPRQNADREPDPLDSLLAQAQWPEPKDEAVERLREFWTREMKQQPREGRRSRHGNLGRWLALAAAVFLAIGLGIWSWKERRATERAPKEVANNPEELQTRPIQPKEDTSPVQGPGLNPKSRVARIDSEVSPLGPRSPTAYERVLLIAARRKQAAMQRFEPPPAVSLPEDRDPAEIARDFARDMAREAARRSSSSVLGQRIRWEQEPELQRELAAMLLVRGDAASVRVFLERVDDSKSAAAALGALNEVERVPVEALVQALSSPRSNERLAGARALGHLNRPEVSRQLIDMVVRGRFRHEALVALLSSSESTAQEFLAKAARNPNLAASVWNAQRQFQNVPERRS